MNLAELAKASHPYGGSVHGQCRALTDIEFLNVYRAAAFIDVMGWTAVARFRDPVTDAQSTTVIQILNEAVAHWGTGEHVKRYFNT
ncbi:hypothetical protein AB0O47_01895 [Streptomyces noursei]|uniref:hypothetical protein n=1 Tax=Streptomyces noursei TaxID=1971 RepID=UPI00344B3751